MIMHVITNFTASAGAETMLARLLRISKEDRITVVSLLGISDRNRNLADNSRVTYISLGAASFASLPGAALKLARLIRQERPRVLVCWMYHAMIAGALAAKLARRRTPVFWNVRQSLDDPASLSRSSRMAVAVARHLSGGVAGIIYNSSRALELHRAYGYRNRNSVVIPNGFEMPLAAAPEPQAPHRFGIAARLHPQKDHATFFKAAALTLETHPDARFSAAGNGLSWDNPAAAKLIAEAGLSPGAIDLKGEVADMDGFYRSIDALVLSSRTEGFPNVIAEAMSHCKPIVTTDVGDAAIVAGDAGITVPARDPEALAKAMRQILDLAPEDYAHLSRKARLRIENEYTLAAIEAKYLDFLVA